MKILVVDNSRSTLLLLNNMLSKYGHAVRTAEGGIEALELLKEFTPDVMLVDWVMPSISGDRLCRMVRAQPGREKIHIIIMSAMLQDQSFDYKSFGADACLAKGPMAEMENNLTTMLAFAGREADLGLSERIIGLENLFPRQATSELIAVKKHFESILNALIDGVLELNDRNLVIYANPAAISMFGGEERKLLAVDFPKLFPLPVSGLIEEAIARSQGQGRPVPLAEPACVAGRELAVTVVAVPEQERPCTVVILRQLCPAATSTFASP
ncbi:MAG: response regulator [Thermodesulfobacteriota bacterium]